MHAWVLLADMFGQVLKLQEFFCLLSWVVTDGEAFPVRGLALSFQDTSNILCRLG